MGIHSGCDMVVTQDKGAAAGSVPHRGEAGPGTESPTH